MARGCFFLFSSVIQYLRSASAKIVSRSEDWDLSHLLYLAIAWQPFPSWLVPTSAIGRNRAVHTDYQTSAYLVWNAVPALQTLPSDESRCINLTASQQCMIKYFLQHWLADFDPLTRWLPLSRSPRHERSKISRTCDKLRELVNHISYGWPTSIPNVICYQAGELSTLNFEDLTSLSREETVRSLSKFLGSQSKYTMFRRSRNSLLYISVSWIQGIATWTEGEWDCRMLMSTDRILIVYSPSWGLSLFLLVFSWSIQERALCIPARYVQGMVGIFCPIATLISFSNPFSNSLCCTTFGPTRHCWYIMLSDVHGINLSEQVANGLKLKASHKQVGLYERNTRFWMSVQTKSQRCSLGVIVIHGALRTRYAQVCQSHPFPLIMCLLYL